MRLANPNDHLAVRLVDVYLNRVCAGRGEELHSDFTINGSCPSTSILAYNDAQNLNRKPPGRLVPFDCGHMQLAQGGVEPLREVRNAVLLAERNHEIDRELRPTPPVRIRGLSVGVMLTRVCAPSMEKGGPSVLKGSQRRKFLAPSRATHFPVLVTFQPGKSNVRAASMSLPVAVQLVQIGHHLGQSSKVDRSCQTSSIGASTVPVATKVAFARQTVSSCPQESAP